MPLPRLFALLVILLGVSPLAAQNQQRFVQLEAYSNQQGQIGNQQRWIEMLSRCGVDRVRIRHSATPPDPRIEEEPGGRSTSIYVTGVILGDRILLPGETLRMSDEVRLKAYFAALKADGASVAMADKLAFGLTPEQLVQVHEELSAVAPRTTRGRPVGEVVKELLEQQQLPFELAPEAERKLGAADLLPEELKGMSVGSAVAAAIRPLGLVLQPNRPQGGRISLRIVPYAEAAENWPVGWPNEQPVSRVAPKLFDRLDLEIRGFSLAQALSALESRIGIPFLYDYNEMARQEIVTEEVKVTLVQKQVAYMVAIGKLLAQSRPQLKQEVRLDENGRPFLWIQPANRRLGN